MRGPLPPSDWPNADNSQIVASVPHRWHVQITGRGPDILLLHGAGASTHSWRHLMPLLADHHRLIAVDLPGHGFTRMGARGRSRLPDVAADLGRLIAQEGWAPRVIIGHSAGAAVALQLARTLPDGVDRIVAINGALENFKGPAGWLFPLMAKMLALNPLTGLLISQRGTNVQSLISATGTKLDEDGLALYGRLMGTRAHVDGTLAMMAQWSLDDLNRALPQIAVPTLFIHGENDSAVPIRVAETAAGVMPDARLLRLPDVGHLAQEEAPDAVAQAITQFLAG